MAMKKNKNNKRGHEHDPNEFCYICGKFIKGDKKNLNEKLQEAYWHYFKTSCADIKKNFTPDFICSSCYRMLYMYIKNPDTKMIFQTPVIWTEVISHHQGMCYFCSIKKEPLKRKVDYFDCENCKIPKIYSPDLADRFHAKINSSESDLDESEDVYVMDEEAEDNKFEWTTNAYHDFCRELKLSKNMSKKCLRMLKKDPVIKQKMTSINRRHIEERNNEIKNLFSDHGAYAFCNNIEGLMGCLRVKYNSDDWCLYIDSSTTSLKAALMYKNNELPTLPIVYANVKEDRDSMEMILKLTKYNDHGWLIMADLKVLNFIMGLKAGYAKYPCFYCMFDTRNSLLDYNSNHMWPDRIDFDKQPLVPLEKIAFPFLHIKLGLWQKFVKTLDNDSECFKFICENIKKSDAKLRNGVFTGPEIKNIMKNVNFPQTMTHLEQNAWLSFCDVANHVLGKVIAEDWQEKIDLLMSNYQAMGCSPVSNKMHLLFKHKDKYRHYLGNFSDEHGERVHQEMHLFENRFHHCLNKEMLSECIWQLKRDTNFFTSSMKCYK